MARICLFFADIMMVHAREHHFVKALPDYHYEHPSLVSQKYAHIMENIHAWWVGCTLCWAYETSQWLSTTSLKIVLQCLLPTRVCIHRRDHAHTCICTSAQSHPHMHVHVSAIRLTCVCARKSNPLWYVHAHMHVLLTCITCMYGLHVYAHTGLHACMHT